jgi:hypothetical protein
MFRKFSRHVTLTGDKITAFKIDFKNLNGKFHIRQLGTFMWDDNIKVDPNDVEYGRVRAKHRNQ